jgi:hypothetical protein
VLHPGDTAGFLCLPQSSEAGNFGTVTTQWWINGSQVANHDITFVDSNFGSHSLLIQNVLLYNGSTIQCSTNGSSGINYSNELILLVEG